MNGFSSTPKNATWDSEIDPIIQHAFAAKKLINVERAYEVMDRFELTGLVASIPHNIYYVSSHWGIMQWMGRHFSTFAYFPRDPSAPPALIAHGTMLYHFDYRPTWIDNVKAISGPVMGQDGQPVLDSNGNRIAQPRPGVWSIREVAEFTHGDRVQMAMLDRYTDRTVVSALDGLREAIVEGGSDKGRVGFDDPRVGGWLRDMGLADLEPVDACNIFKEIRRQKTPNEIVLLRNAARANESALDHAISRVEPGQLLAQVELDFNIKWAELGGIAKWLICNVNGLNSGTIETGQWMKLDSVGMLKGYHGDVGRTVMVGEPEEELAKRIEASTRTARVIYDFIRPGMKYGDIAARFRKTMLEEEGIVALGGPHDVGLEHTDHPVELGIPGLPADLPQAELEFLEGTVFTLDMPHNEMGWGTSHIEDMMLVTKHGCEFLSSGDTSLRIVR